MSSPIEELIPIAMAKGSNMRIFIDHVRFLGPLQDRTPVNNRISSAAVQTRRLARAQLGRGDYDGKEDSVVLAVPGHWHKDHDEILEVLEGRMIIYLDRRELVTSAGDPPILVRRGHIHGFTVIKGERVRATERTMPTGPFKALFFQDMFQDGKGLPGFLLAMRASYDGDMYTSLSGRFQTLDYLFTVVVGFLAKPFVSARPATLKRLEK
ncbi:hypothetical protein MMC15_004663 [Xylographa vitiligo]|nr:hypothetical protein [Xylographa vitiligo]